MSVGDWLLLGSTITFVVGMTCIFIYVLGIKDEPDGWWKHHWDYLIEPEWPTGGIGAPKEEADRKLRV